MAGRSCHLLRRQRRLWHDGWSVRVREPVQRGLRRAERGAEHGTVQRGAELRCVLRDKVRGRPQVVPPGEPFHLRDGHQLLPSQLRSPQRQRRLVQPTSPSLRPRHAHVPQDRRVPSRHRPRLLPQGAVPEIGGDPVHHKRVPLLQPAADHQRRRRRRHRASEREGNPHWMDEHEQELGAELAVQRRPRRASPLLPRHRQRPPHLHLMERRPSKLAVRTDLRRQELPGLNTTPGCCMK